MSDPAAEEQWEAFLSRYLPNIQEQARRSRALMQARLPGAVELVYDNYNALVIGYGPTERTGDAVFSLALYPRWITLFFLRGHLLSDPDAVLQGDGKLVRQFRLASPEDLSRPEVQSLIAQSLAIEGWEPQPGEACRLVIKSISPNQRPRVPTAKGK